MLTVRVSCPAELTGRCEQILQAVPSLTSMSRFPGASIDPPGDVFEAQVERDAVNDVVGALTELGVPARGTIQILQPGSWVSQRALDAEQQSPDADNVVWPQVIEQAYEQSKITPIFLAFMTMATLLAAIAVITDSPILVVGAMVLGPEFMAVISLGLALVRRRPGLLRQAARTLVIGFAFSITVTVGFVALARATGLATLADIEAPRPGVAFIYTPNAWSLIVAVIAAAAGVLALTSSQSTGIIGVFISVTTIPAAGNIAVGIVFARWNEVLGSTWQLGINVTGMAIAGWATLAIRQWNSQRTSRALALRSPRQLWRRQGVQRPHS
ncbi:MAG: DUF389 domain-containing protein [Candidatus Nanopelagicales bacterium]